MNDVVIKVENLSKQYRLGAVGTGTLSHDLNRFWAKIRGKEDPYLKIGESNDRTRKGESQYVWALKDINFEVKRGEVLGIIGRNGAGKSTLLKILSQITRPTTGSVKMKGRVGSLLEVGTGFHPDLTGRENVYINGAILGMRKWEIDRKLDEIIDFAGVERYIDTPVKRYSSGMMVRLGFSVAAHLEPEILIVDEVLAVGDAEFQKKCLGKMGEVSRNDGRTILFVSHNLNAIKQLCNKGLYVERGSSSTFEDVAGAITRYLSSKNEGSIALNELKRSGKQDVTIQDVSLSKDTYNLFESIELKVLLQVKTKIANVNVGFSIHNSYSENIFQVYGLDFGETFNVDSQGMFEIIIKMPDQNFAVGSYTLGMRIESNGIEQDWPRGAVARFKIEDQNLKYKLKDEFTNKLVFKPDYQIFKVK